jgi:hypothetical protein
VKLIRRACPGVPGFRSAQPPGIPKTATAAVGNLVSSGPPSPAGDARLPASSAMPGLCPISSAVSDGPGSSLTRLSSVIALAAYARGSNRTDGDPPTSGARSSQVCRVRCATEHTTVSGT